MRVLLCTYSSYLFYLRNNSHMSKVRLDWLWHLNKTWTYMSMQSYGNNISDTYLILSCFIFLLFNVQVSDIKRNNKVHVTQNVFLVLPVTGVFSCGTESITEFWVEKFLLSRKTEWGKEKKFVHIKSSDSIFIIVVLFVFVVIALEYNKFSNSQFPWV